MKEQPRAPRITISAERLKYIIVDEHFKIQSRPDCGLPSDLVEELAKAIVNRAGMKVG
jgi:hypothetical protein